MAAAMVSSLKMVPHLLRSTLVVRMRLWCSSVSLMTWKSKCAPSGSVGEVAKVVDGKDFEFAQGGEFFF